MGITKKGAIPCELAPKSVILSEQNKKKQTHEFDKITTFRAHAQACGARKWSS